MTKSTAMMIVLATDDGENKQQMIVLPSNVVYRRTLTGSTRTRWRFASVPPDVDASEPSAPTGRRGKPARLGSRGALDAPSPRPHVSTSSGAACETRRAQTVAAA